ncbi:biotin--[acetyl-CoA-carboxylase] ligase [Erythrobacter sp. Dej080120_24]|uniref:biotin--[acetyl-CoA-carboxylase] ligase n=1 Tax=unclassified Erythrobacter TaxID=2633097 RepID=UPI00291CDA4D|nr:biotin--[acetyl-CoA-carboxylase] ligase [Erythrobacter sp. Dej080120_24]
MIEIVAETGSTNADIAARLRAAESIAEGYWLVARRQTAGRGRQGRTWFDGAGNFMGSTAVAIRAGDPPPASLSFVAALAVADGAAEALPVPSQLKLKWPNDVMLDGGKLSGILLEMVGHQVVVGIGVNLEHAPELSDRKTSAISEHGPAPELEWFADMLARHFESRVRDWRERGLGSILADFLASSIHAPGSPVKVHDTDGTVLEGTFAGLEETDGALRLRLADGSERVIRAGDIS